MFSGIFQQIRHYFRTPRYVLALIFLVVIVVGTVAVFGNSLEKRNLQETLRRNALALAKTLAISSQNALVANRLLEDLVAQRLLDNARLIDFLLPEDPSTSTLTQIAALNRLACLEVLDIKGNKIATSQCTPEMRGTMRRFYDPILRGKAQEAFDGFGEEKFWLGDNYAVAVRRIQAPGVIVITAAASYILNFRKEIGIQRLIEDLKDHPYLAYIALQDIEHYTYIAHTDPRLIGTKEGEEWFLQGDVVATEEGQMRLLHADDRRILEVTRPFFFKGRKIGLFRVALDRSHIERIWRQSLASIAAYSFILLLISSIGVAAISRIQEKRWERVQQLERELEQNKKLAALGNLAAGVAHEIKNPLNAISMGIQRLQKQFLLTNTPKTEFLQLSATIRKEIQRLNEIVENTMQLARPLPLQKETFHPLPLFQDLGVLMEEEAKARDITWRMLLPPSYPLLIGDPKQIKQTLLNVLLNAFQATKPGGEVTLYVEETEEFLGLHIVDTGIGMTPIIIEKIFDPYFTTRERGMGLGLSIAHHIIESHGGKITVESQPGQGTIFHIFLPVAKEKNK